MAVKKSTGKKKITKNIDKGCVHIHASFNNTIVTVTDEQGNAIAACSAVALKFLFAQEHAVRIADVGVSSRAPRYGTRIAFGQSLCQRSRFGQRVGYPRYGSSRTSGDGNQRRVAHPA